MQPMQIENQLAHNVGDESGAAGADQEAQQQSGALGGEEGEFRLTVKKLEMAVRPRGVLAE